MYFFVPFVPSSNAEVLKMVAAAQLKDGDHVLDLGCGDGRLLIEAEKNAKIKGIGFELAPLVFILAFVRLKLSKCKSKVYLKNMFSADLSNADVIFCYLIPNIMQRITDKIKKECRPGTRIISNTFHLPNLELTQTLSKDQPPGTPTIYIYTI